MELLYKYYSDKSEHAVPNLKKGVITFSSIDVLNDPFEGVGAFLYRTDDEEQRIWDSLGVPDFPKTMEEMTSYDGHEMITFNYRVFCASKDYDNPLLWAHYANSHNGFCVGYDKKIISDISEALFDIDYSDTMYQFDEFNDETCRKLLSIKSNAWKKENECRALYIIKGTDLTDLPYESPFDKKTGDEKLYRTEIYNDPMNNKIIKKTLCANKFISVKCPPIVIYLGLRINAELKTQLIDIARQYGIKIYQMSQHKNSFGLVPREVDLTEFTLLFQKR